MACVVIVRAQRNNDFYLSQAKRKAKQRNFSAEKAIV